MCVGGGAEGSESEGFVQYFSSAGDGVRSPGFFFKLSQSHGADVDTATEELRTTN